MEITSVRRTELLDEIVDALLEGGVAELSLRPLAERVGTSARLLIYHFETKEKLLASALRQVRARIATSLTARAAQDRPGSPRAALLMFWTWAIEPAHQPYFRLLFEVDGLSMFNRQTLPDGNQREGTTMWLGLIERVTAGRGDLFGGDSTLILAALNGLLQDFLSTGDGERTTAALHALLDLVPDDRRAPAPTRAT
jgi:AcrR family transcriptional regulator